MSWPHSARPCSARHLSASKPAAGRTCAGDGRPAGGPAVALIGHFDTVWPLGTLARWPFAADRAACTATGPGCFDMKAGIVQLLHAVAALGDPAGLEILLTSDEEIGSPTSRVLVEQAAAGADAALILEPSAHGALKIGRKGTGWYRLSVAGPRTPGWSQSAAPTR